MMSWTCSLAFRSIPCSSCKHAVRPIRRMHCHALSTSGARFVRKHILRLAPYKPIVPFEILSGIIAWPSPRGCSTSICFNLYRALSSTEELGIAPEDIVKLDANENPYGPPPGFFFLIPYCATSPHHTLTEVELAMSNLRFPHVYPDPESRTLRRALVGNVFIS